MKNGKSRTQPEGVPLSGGVFAAVLFWWTIGGKGQNWEIGFPSVTMIVAVVTAVIAILTLVHG